MRFLQTSDWHLGKIFYEISLVEDQRYFLNQIISEIAKESESENPYDALLVPGDIYDKAIPPQDAVSLFDEFLTELKERFPSLYVVIISGNHDSPTRLNFAKSFFRKSNIFICTTPESITEPVELKSNGEKAYIYSIPFLYPNDIKNDENELFTATHSQQEMYDFATQKIWDEHKKKHSDGFSVLCTHLFACEASVEKSERRNIGTAEQVDANLFHNFDYTAVGHIHSYQPCGKEKNMYYSGAPLSYDFGDTPTKFMLSVELKKNQEPQINKIEFKPLHKVTRLEGSFSDFFGSNTNKELIQKHKDDYVEIICTDDILPSSPITLLRPAFPNILSFRMKEFVESEISTQMQQRRNAITNSKEALSDEIFQIFLEEINKNLTTNDELITKEKKLFNSLINQTENN